jgi:hypothetical protein
MSAYIKNLETLKIELHYCDGWQLYKYVEKSA